MGEGRLLKALCNSVTIGDVGLTDSEFERSILFNEFFRKNNDDTFYCVGGAHLTKWGRRWWAFTEIGAPTRCFAESSSIFAAL